MFTQKEENTKAATLVARSFFSNFSYLWEHITISCVRRKNMSIRAMRNHCHIIPLKGKRPTLIYISVITTHCL